MCKFSRVQEKGGGQVAHVFLENSLHRPEFQWLLKNSFNSFLKEPKHELFACFDKI